VAVGEVSNGSFFDQNTGHHNSNDAEGYEEDRYHSDHDVDPHSGSQEVSIDTFSSGVVVAESTTIKAV